MVQSGSQKCNLEAKSCNLDSKVQSGRQFVQYGSQTWNLDAKWCNLDLTNAIWTPDNVIWTPYVQSGRQIIQSRSQNCNLDAFRVQTAVFGVQIARLRSRLRHLGSRLHHLCILGIQIAPFRFQIAHLQCNSSVDLDLKSTKIISLHHKFITSEKIIICRHQLRNNYFKICKINSGSN